MAAFVYEGVLLFGVLMIAGYLYSALTQMRHALQGTLGLQIFLFVVLGIYFIWFWSRGGQTVAMKAWHIKLLDARGQAVSQARAAVRYLLAWLWFAPALLAAHLSGLKSGAAIFGILFAGVAAYAALARLHPQRQFWHDVVCGTRLVDARPAKKPAA
ncbi:RDD family protein [Ideonella sp.]|uniref:RDD family protein n=1 Tax=Ideonella sp. TaxID=1929293 RepID=UPI0035B060C6